MAEYCYRPVLINNNYIIIINYLLFKDTPLHATSDACIVGNYEFQMN